MTQNSNRPKIILRTRTYNNKKGSATTDNTEQFCGLLKHTKLCWDKTNLLFICDEINI